MQPESAPRTSFFDDDDTSIHFGFTKPEKTHLKHLSSLPIIKTILSKHPTDIDSFDKNVFALHGRLLVVYENMSSKVPIWVLDLAHSRLDIPNSIDNHSYSFGVVRNGSTYKFYSSDKKVIENWIAALKNICVLTNFHEEYKALKMIGKGSFAKVYLVEAKTSKKNFAVKAFTKEGVIISNKANAKPAMLNEIDIMRAVDHENVIKLYEVYETERSIYLVLELIQGKSLQEMLKKGVFKEENSETKIVNIIRTIFEALAHLASKGVMHRDLKPDNILLEKGEKVKIVDFGLATFIDLPEYIFKKCGTPGYIAPEIFKYDVKIPSTAYNHRCDVFSIGCILYYMLFGNAFFEGSNASEILKCNRKFTTEYEAVIRVKKEARDPTGKISKEGVNLLLQLLEFDHKKRPTAVQALGHPFLCFGGAPIQRIPGFQQCNEDNSRSHSQSPIKVRASHSGSPDKFSPYNADKNRYTDKDSLYLDVGRADTNGKVDSAAGGMTHNSLLYANRGDHGANGGSTNRSLSPFAKNGHGDIRRPSSKSFKGHSLIGPNQGFLKATIYRNIHKNNDEESKDDGSPSPSPVLRFEQIRADKRHRNSYQVSASTQPSSGKSRPGSQSPGYQRSDTVSSDNSTFQLKIEQVQPNASNPINVSKFINSATRKYPITQKK